MFQIGIPTNQDRLIIKIHSKNITEAVVMKAYITEVVSRLTEMEIYLQTNKSVEIEKLINEQISLSIEYDGLETRYFSGVITNISFENIPSTITTKVNNILYIKTKSAFEKTIHTKNHKTFKNLSKIEIIKKIFKKNDLTNVNVNVTLKKDEGIGGSQSSKTPENSQSSKSENFCVQYNESDFNFVSRLMEEAGIFYYFEHFQDKDILNICDNSIACKKIKTVLNILRTASNATLQINDAYNVSMTNSIGVKKVGSFFYNEMKAETISGISKATDDKLKTGQNEFFNKKFFEQKEAEDISKINLERENSVIRSLTGNSYCHEMFAGGIFKIDGSTNHMLNGEFFAIEVRHTINQLPKESGDTPIYTNSFKAIPSKIPYRPLAVHKKPEMPGVYTATVIGPEGEEIHCNEQGMVLVRFPWGESGYIRVAQAWAGSEFGSVIIPRIGMEVLVTFINGDPDSPLIIGCVYNGVNKQPENYPALRKTVSSFRTKSSKGAGYNELRFEDKAGSEEIFVHAQKDLNYLVENDLKEVLNTGSRSTTINGKKTENSLHIIDGSNNIIINEGDNKVMLNSGDYKVTLDKGNNSITLNDGDQFITLKNGNLSIEASGDIIVSAKNINFNAKESISLKASKAISLEADRIVSIKSGAEFSLECSNGNFKASSGLNFSALNISTKATMSLSMESSAMAKISAGATMSLNASAAMTLSGGASLTLGGAIVTIG